MTAKMALANVNKNMDQTSNLLTYYLSMNMNSICRICLEKSKRLTPIFDPIKPPHFSVLIMACASVQVQKDDGLPPYICQRCISTLNVAFQFKNQCESSDAKLRQCVEKHSLELTQSSEPDQNSSAQGESEYASDNQAAFDQSEVSEEKYHDLSFFENDNLEGKTEETDYKEAITEVKREKRGKVHQCNICSKIFRTKPSLIHHIRIHTGERPYVCHLCQKRFVNGGHLHTHMKTHTGEKNHVCAACNKGFATAQQLTKHTIAIHTSERPYGCTYCPKRFASSSNLNTHIKIHTGEKNFHCETCGKMFSTKGQLQQHKLVHTGEKAFLCEFCNKRFSQKAHLMRHLRIHDRTE